MCRGPLEAAIDIAAPPSTVWAAVSDLAAMKRRSPELVGMWMMRPVKPGRRGINLNRRKGFVWPTASRITRWKPPELDSGDAALAFRVWPTDVEWSYELEPTTTGTLLTERRTAPPKDSLVVRLTARFALGGAESHDRELLEGMNTTLAALKAEAEAG